MTTIEIKKKLFALANTSNERKMQREIAEAAIWAVDPVQFLRDMYRNKGLKRDLHRGFFEAYQSEIFMIIDQSELKVKWLMNSENYMIELSFLASQLTLEKMMVQFGLLLTEETFFADYDILELHAGIKKKNARYGISDFVIPIGVTPSKYVKVCDEKGKVLTEAEVYFIEEETIS